MSQPLILVCDDERDLREMLQEYLVKRGFRVKLAADAQALRDAIEADAPELILLDINMPDEDGLSALRALRVTDDVPVVMLTAAGETVDRIVGLEMGADDYLGKPFDLRELEARIKAVLRRRASRPGAVPAGSGEGAKRTVKFGDFTLDLDGARMVDGEGQELPLTAMEFRLLRLFAENRGRVLNRDQILEQAHDRSWDPFDRSIDIRISRLRRKIERNPQKPSVIRTVRGLGYIFDPGHSGSAPSEDPSSCFGCALSGSKHDAPQPEEDRRQFSRVGILREGRVAAHVRIARVQSFAG